MGGKIREIKGRIKSVKNTCQITKAMEMVSSSKFKRFNSYVLNARPYNENLKKILSHIASGVSNEKNPLFEGKKEVKKICIIVVNSDRGLCGSYNNGITKEMIRFVRSKEAEGKEISIIAVGKKIRDYVRKHEFDMKAEYTQLVPENMFEKAKQISENIVDFYYEDIFDEVYMLYSKFISAINSQITLTRLLPIEKFEASSKDSYIFEPSESEILNELVPKYLNISIYQNLLEATASEHAARMRAMRSASDNAVEIIDKMSLVYNRARQAAITQELAEIVGGAESLK